MLDIFASAIDEINAASNETDEPVIAIEDDSVSDTQTLDNLVDESDCVVREIDFGHDENPNRGSLGVKPKRASPVGKAPKLTAVPIENADESLPCVMVGPGGEKGTTKPIPMWPQYTVDWGGLTAGTYIIFGNYELWLLSAVDAMTSYGSGQKTRKLARKTIETVGVEWKGYLDQARTPIQRKNPFGDDSEDTPNKRLRRSRTVDKGIQQKEIVVNIGGIDVKCLNDARRLIMKLDSATARCIAEWLVPIIALLKKKDEEQHVESPKDDKVPAGFQFVGDPTPNIRDKVWWIPASHSWHVSVKCSSGPEYRSFAVDSGLPSTEYDASKRNMYNAAIAEWNKLDKSSRHRILLK